MRSILPDVQCFCSPLRLEESAGTVKPSVASSFLRIGWSKWPIESLQIVIATVCIGPCLMKLHLQAAGTKGGR